MNKFSFQIKFFPTNAFIPAFLKIICKNVFKLLYIYFKNKNESMKQHTN